MNELNRGVASNKIPITVEILRIPYNYYIRLIGNPFFFTREYYNEKKNNKIRNFLILFGLILFEPPSTLQYSRRRIKRLSNVRTIRRWRVKCKCDARKRKNRPKFSAIRGVWKSNWFLYFPCFKRIHFASIILFRFSVTIHFFNCCSCRAFWSPFLRAKSIRTTVVFTNRLNCEWSVEYFFLAIRTHCGKKIQRRFTTSSKKRHTTG